MKAVYNVLRKRKNKTQVYSCNLNACMHQYENKKSSYLKMWIVLLSEFGLVVQRLGITSSSVPAGGFSSRYLRMELRTLTGYFPARIPRDAHLDSRPRLESGSSREHTSM